MDLHHSSFIEDYIPQQFHSLSDIAISPLTFPTTTTFSNYTLSCRNCRSILFNNTTPSESVITDDNMEIMNDRILIRELYCQKCHTFIGFKIVDFKPNEYTLIPMNNQLKVEDIYYDINNYQNDLIRIENSLNQRAERISFETFWKNNQQHIGDHYIYCANVMMNGLISMRS